MALGMMVSKALCETPFIATVIVAVAIVETGCVSMATTTLFAPGETAAAEAVRTTDESAETVRVAPPAGAGPVSRITPLVPEPPITEGGVNVNEAGTNGVPGGVTISSALVDVPLYDAVTMMGSMKFVGNVRTLKVALVAPTGTPTVGITAPVQFDEN